MTAEKIEQLSLSEDPIYRLDYLLLNERYVYTTHKIEGLHRYMQILTKNNQIASFSLLNNSREAYHPFIRTCTLFPVKEWVKVEKCLAQFTESVVAAGDKALARNPIEEDAFEKQRKSNEVVGTIFFAGIISPVLIPAAIVSLPIIIADNEASSEVKSDFSIKLGRNSNLNNYLSSLDDEQISRFEESGAAYIKGGFLDLPAVSFGFEGNTVIWIQLNPYVSCRGGFMFWDNKCRTGL